MAGLSWIKEAARLALADRKRVKEGDMSAFILPLVAAISKDGILDFIPIFGGVIGFCITLYLFVFMWGRGKWKVRLIMFFFSLIETVPFISILPLQTTAVLYGYHLAKKAAKEAGIELTLLEQAKASLRRAEQMAFQQQQMQKQDVAEEIANDTEYQQQAANDNRYQSTPMRKFI